MIRITSPTLIALIAARSRVFMAVFSAATVCAVPACRDVTAISQKEEAKVARIQKEIGLPLSPETKVVEFYEPERIVDPVWVAKVALPEKAYDSFHEAVAAKQTDTTTVRGALAESVRWWYPGDVVLTKQYLADQHTLVNVIVAKEDEGFFAYIECGVF